MNKTLRMGGWAALASLTFLAGCGDSSVLVEPVVSNEVPVSATASVQAYTSYAKSLGADDQADPLLVDKVMPPTSETDEPASLS